jgi:hypothetical protein
MLLLGMGKTLRQFGVSTAGLLFMAQLPMSSGGFSQTLQNPGSYEARLSGLCQSVSGLKNASIGDFRLRNGARLSASGARHTIYVDAGAEALVTGTASLVYVAKGGKATVGGERNQVIAERGGSVVLLGRVNLLTVDQLDVHVHKNSVACQ